MVETDKPKNPARRGFLGGAVAGAAAGGLAVGLYAAQGQAADNWDETHDTIVVGGGPAGCSAAITAHELGDKVVLLEKSAALGGTAAKSVGGVWIPNNRFMRKAGLSDAREDCLRYMVRLSFPTDYNAAAPKFGATEAAYNMMGAFYDNAPRVVDKLEEIGAIKLFAPEFNGALTPDYFAHLPENKAPRGRCLSTADRQGNYASGAELMRSFAAAITQRNIPVKKRCKATQIIKDDNGVVIGIVAQDAAGKDIRLRAAKGVIFASGGFIHNPEMRKAYLKGPIFGACAVPTNQGDFIDMGIAAGARLGNMANAWWAQTVLEWALENPSVPTGIWSTPGDSMIQVNRKGERFMDEKFVYNERTQAHFYWDAVTSSYPNLLSFMIYDQRTADQYAGVPPLPAKGTRAPYVLTGATLAELSGKIDARLKQIVDKTAGFTLDPGFLDGLNASVARFNQSARDGVDVDFRRGNQPIDMLFHSLAPEKPTQILSNRTLYPIADAGPYYAIIMAPGALDTKGGPVIDEQAQVIGLNNKPIPGLYAAGNCNAGFAGVAYWGGGATLGVCMTYGVLAAEAANKRARTA